MLPLFFAGQKAVNTSYFDRGILLSIKRHHNSKNRFDIKVFANKITVAPKTIRLRLKTVLACHCLDCDVLVCCKNILYMYTYIGQNFQKVIVNSTACDSFNCLFRPGKRTKILGVCHCWHYRRWRHMFVRHRHQFATPIQSSIPSKKPNIPSFWTDSSVNHRCSSRWDIPQNFRYRTMTEWDKE